MDLEFELSSTDRAPRRARYELSALADALPSEPLSDLGVIVAELITNSVRFGPGSSIRVQVTVDPDGRVTGEVTDGGSGGVEMRESYSPTSGLGLLIVDSLASSWGIRPDSSTVWFELAAHAYEEGRGPQH